MPAAARRCAIWATQLSCPRWPRCLRLCTKFCAEDRHDLAPRLSLAPVAALALGVPAPVVARTAPAGLPRTYRRAFRLVRGCAATAGNLAARRIGGRNTGRRTLGARLGNAL